MWGVWLYTTEGKTKRTREAKETLIIKIYVHNVVTCFFNFLSTSFPSSCPLKLSWFSAATEAFSSFVNKYISLSVWWCPPQESFRKTSHLTSTLPFPVHRHTNYLFRVGHCRNCHFAGALNVREPHPADDSPLNEPSHYVLRIWTVNHHASIDSRERKYSF